MKEFKIDDVTFNYEESRSYCPSGYIVEVEAVHVPTQITAKKRIVEPVKLRFTAHKARAIALRKLQTLVTAHYLKCEKPVAQTKQVILVRKDLEMPPGKLAAQVAHASMAAILNEGKWTGRTEGDGTEHNQFFLDCKCAMNYWLPPGNAFAKVVLGVKNLTQLEKYENMAIELELPYAKITDEGRTVFDGTPTVTCLAIGPGYNEDVDLITGKLQLY